MEIKWGDGPFVLYYPNQSEGGTKLYGLTGAYKNSLVLFLSHKQQFDSNLITVQQDETYSVYYISVGSSTCFGC